ncbi:MAG: lyase family protein, partial [Phycisphaeraceae bacterium]
MSTTSKPWEHAKSDGSEAAPLAARFVSSLDYDKRLYTHDIRGSKAHAAMLQKVGLITPDDLTAIYQGLDEIEAEIAEQGDAWPGWKVELEDVHMCVENALIEKAGEAGKKLHTGRSRNDQVALDLTMWVHDASCDLIGGRLYQLMIEFMKLAEQYGHVVMPSYTHLQRAQPIVAGGELVAWVTAIGECQQRFRKLFMGNGMAVISGLTTQSDMTSPLGSGAIAGSSLPLDTELTAAFLAGEKPEEMIDLWPLRDSSMFHTASRDVALDFAYALTMTSMWLSRWAEQWIIYATTEFKFITL